jgi:putative PIN family toxin of toxin-antitoxin system
VRVVTDTNVVVSGLLWLGNPGRLLEAAANGRITLYTSPVLVAELRSTLSYARLAKYIQRSGLTPDELLTRYLNVAIVVEPATVPQVVRDPDDDHVLACAFVAQVDLIATGDTDLLDLKAYQSIEIVTPADALLELRRRNNRGHFRRFVSHSGRFTSLPAGRLAFLTSPL